MGHLTVVFESLAKEKSERPVAKVIAKRRRLVRGDHGGEVARKSGVVSFLALAIGAVVSVTGVIGFVGLVAPHFIRPLVGYNPQQSLLPSG